MGWSLGRGMAPSQKNEMNFIGSLPAELQATYETIQAPPSALKLSKKNPPGERSHILGISDREETIHSRTLFHPRPCYLAH